MKKLLKKILGGIRTAWDNLNSGVRKWVPVSVKVVEAMKNFNDSGAADFLEFVVTTAIPGDADNVMVAQGRQLIRVQFPKILLGLKVIGSIADLTDDNEKMKAILNELNLSSTKGIIYKGVAGRFFELAADGKFSFDDSVNLTSYYFQQLQAQANATDTTPKGN